MAFSAYPFDGVDVTEAQYGLLFREFQNSGVIDSYDGTEFTVTADSSGMKVNLSPGSAILRGHAVHSDAPEVLTVAPAHASQTRWDQAVLELNPTTNSILPKVLSGVPGSGTPAAVTQTDTGIYQLQLARIRVQAGAVSITQADITDRRRLVTNGAGTWSDDTRPAGRFRRVGMLGYNVNLGAFEFWTGTAWEKLQPTLSWASITGKPSKFPPTTHGHAWSEITGKPTEMRPSAHQHTWGDITGKPASFTPAPHVHNWETITGKPTTFRPAPHKHYWADIIDDLPDWLKTGEAHLTQLRTDVDTLKVKAVSSEAQGQSINQLVQEVNALKNRVTSLESSLIG